MNDGQFKKALENLNGLILQIGNGVENTIIDSFMILEKRDIKKAQQIINNDKSIDFLELKINEDCLRLLALYQPVASDLRFITTAMSIVTDLERIADLASDIASRVIEMGNEPLIKPLIDIPKMVNIAKDMLHKSLRAYVKRDTRLAKEVSLMRQKTDDLRDLIYNELEEVMTKNPQRLSRGLPLILITHHLDRIISHTENIAEDVVYMVDAQVIKHRNIKN
ncbi:phosphate transport system regulatory protein PhoU [Candidatus Gottesmanbacteria bacterium CG11_big_fil_rev_8_21_14_0_20_37_11]|uniref:Phosphate-specific transport system accessory protein PhoU n=3 Tax=Candidatus Gottesmaniibacteriota TaxID=1752720 RepID=A0A2M7RTE5_9BACT|nr:MAG: phosphate transport system regulatory protein PhoU [Candidatus Gottesmanbacteria bacterium CG1_02_37_22]PIP33312.1 MAG: phosphate transport system regulatory protein PhoU [Candidatus Gottesmanbacteria bacterium CG23_combo_of_CG06-09_8_20_14_all_37_19]PIR08818.1 MAG: phosphate transport system regulatory protein PhoU [Candidatus Gottesmanbacteria bacterium CG11_big_fil_rev_8_21_14_0_20_37_11]PIZ03329.1 MAG: phosphate transport system regulatory protein PhoU [Candidatus Gottesmanbacteria b